jgi:hypothetical protein
MSQVIDRHLIARLISGHIQELELDSFSSGEWVRIARMAQLEGVGPLLYWELSRSGGIACLPKPVSDCLRAMYFTTRMNNEQIIREMETLARLFERAGIPVVALKGACFALTIYPDIGLRPMADLDLLVPAARSKEALQIVRDHGYEYAVTEALPGLRDLLEHAVCLQKNAAPYTMLEIHHTLVAEESFYHAVPVDWFWSQIEPMKELSAEIDTAPVCMLAPTAQAIYACAHAMLQHGGRYASLRWLYDIDRLIFVYAGRIDWDLLLRQARRFEWGSAVSAALSQARAFFGTPVPGNILEALAGEMDRNSDRVITLQDPPLTHTFEEYQKLKSLDLHARLRLAWALVAPAPAYMRVRYGLKSNWLLPAWYFYRWWGILKDAVKTLWLLTQERVLSKQLLTDRQKTAHNRTVI